MQLILTIGCEKDADNMTSRYGMANELFQLYFEDNSSMFTLILSINKESNKWERLQLSYF
jgi:hypothetical protein